MSHSCEKMDFSSTPGIPRKRIPLKKGPSWFPHGLAIAGVLLSIPKLSHALEFPINEAATRALYQKLELDYRTRGVWSNSQMNRNRNGVASPYLGAGDTLEDVQAAPVPSDVIALIPEAEFVPYSLFSRAIRGMRSILANFPAAGIQTGILTIVDFDKKTEARRLYVFDLKSPRVLFHTWAQHGDNSDRDRDRLPEEFSNVNGSYQSSLGFVLTSRTPYKGSFGYSLRMHGIDESLNSLVHSRAIVFHPWPTLHPRGVSTLEASNTSLGCISLPWYESGRFYGLKDQPLSRLIIDTIKGRSVVFVSSSTVDLDRESLYLSGASKLSATVKNRILSRLDRETRALSVDSELPRLPDEYRAWSGLVDR